MSRADSAVALRARVKDLETELARWKQDYKDLALAMARRDGYPVTPVVPPVAPVIPPALAALPPSVLTAIETTTAPYTEARTAAVDVARALLEGGAQPEDVVDALRVGDEVII